jgi:hypothetical protein
VSNLLQNIEHFCATVRDTILAARAVLKDRGLGSPAALVGLLATLGVAACQIIGSLLTQT